MRRNPPGEQGTDRWLEKSLNSHFRWEERQGPLEYPGDDAPQMAGNKVHRDPQRIKAGEGDVPSAQVAGRLHWREMKKTHQCMKSQGD